MKKLYAGIFAKAIKILTIILVCVINICLGQVTHNKEFYVNISLTDSIQILPPDGNKLIRDSIARHYNNTHQSSRALERFLLKIENPVITRNSNDVIEVKLLNGEKIELIPNKAREEADFIFSQFYGKLKLLLFRVQWNEGNNFALIDITNGRKTYIMGQPYFSPDNKFMIAINCDLEAQYSENGFELFEFIGREFKKVWTYDPKNWGPIDIMWIDDSTAISRNKYLYQDNKEKTTYMKIKLRHRNSP